MTSMNPPKPDDNGEIATLNMMEGAGNTDGVDPVVEKENLNWMANEMGTDEKTKDTKEDNVITVVARFEEDEPLPSYWWYRLFTPLVSKAFKAGLLIALIGFTIGGLVLNLDHTLNLLYIEIAVGAIVLFGVVKNLEVVKDAVNSLIEKAENLSMTVVIVIRVIVCIIFVIIAVVLSLDELERLYGLGGLVVLIFVCYLFSWDPKNVNWRPVFWGFSLQYIFGLIILRTEPGEAVFQFFGDQIQALLDYTAVGTEFVFGELFTEPVFTPFALLVLPVIIFFAGITSVLFHFGLLQSIVLFIGNLMKVTMGTSAPESLSAAGNIFLGQTESPLMIRPYLKIMTNSEIHAVMTGGFATIAGGVLAAFISFGVPADHLLSASVMSAPAALAISKLVYPETVKVDDSHIDKIDIGETYVNIFEAFTRGATVSISLIANIIVNLIAFLALIAFLDVVTAFIFLCYNVEMTFQQLIGYIFVPFAFLMGIDSTDVIAAGELIGVKVVANEFLAFIFLTDINAPPVEPGGRTFIILTYALCGFSNFSSIGIQLGALGAMEPSKLKNMSKLALSAMLCGNIACFMTACIAGVLVE